MTSKNNAKPIVQKTTTNYNLFYPSESNRARMVNGEFQPRKDLVDSMRKHGFSKMCPITCIDKSGRYEIIDGHNRFVAAKFLSLPIEYIVYQEGYDLGIEQYNKTQKSWLFDDYVNSYAKKGNENYIEIIRYSKSTGIPMSIAAAFFGGHSGSDNFSDAIKNGTFIIKDSITPYVIAMVVNAVKSVNQKAVKRNMHCALGKIAFVPDFSMSELADRIKRNPFLVEEKRSADDYIEMFESIYNYRRRGGDFHLAIKVKEVMERRRAQFRTKA